MKFFDNLWSSARSAFSLGNLVKRVGYFLLFGFLLGLTKLISGLDSAGATGAGLRGYASAVMSAMRYGLGIAHATVWDFARGALGADGFISTHAWGTIIFSSLFFIGLMGFWFQPVSLIINLLDFKGQKETGDKAGNATDSLIRLLATFAIVLLISPIIYYSGISASIAGGNADRVDEPIPDNSTVDINASPPDDNVSIINSLDMLTGGG